MRILSYAEEFQSITLTKDNAVLAVKPRKDRKGADYVVHDKIRADLAAHVPVEGLAQKWPIPKDAPNPTRFYHTRFVFMLFSVFF